MKIFRYFLISLESVLIHKMRAILTMLGIIIGVAAVLTTVGIGRGAAADITGRIESQGTNLLTINPGSNVVGGVRGGSGSAGTLTLNDAEALLDTTFHPTLALVAPQYSSNARLVYDDVNTSEQVVGTVPDFITVRNASLAVGQFFDEQMVVEQQAVVVLGSNLSEDLFGEVDPIGLTVRINNQPFQIIGVLEETGGFGNSVDNQAFIPLPIAQKRLFNAPRYRGDYTVTSITAQTINSEVTDEAELQIEATLRLRHGLKDDDANDFNIFNQASLLETASQITTTLTLFLGAIGAISLLVGGIGIMNIMLVSVTERTREIGLRKAVGAQDYDILLQFLIEALVLCTLGGIFGVLLSYGIASIFASISAITFTVKIELDSILLGVGVSLMSGLIFGLYPAVRATQLDPIEALRYE